MNLFFRLLLISIFSKFRKPVAILGPCLTPFRCWPTDLDVLRHMNNGVYFSIMDLARVDLMIRANLMSKLNEAELYPVVVAETMRFRKSIQPFEAFKVETRILGWDEKAFIVQQRFLIKESCLAEAIVRARFLKKSGGSVTPKETLKLADYHGPSPALPDWVVSWNAHHAK